MIYLYKCTYVQRINIAEPIVHEHERVFVIHIHLYMFIYVYQKFYHRNFNMTDIMILKQNLYIFIHFTVMFFTSNIFA